MNTQTQGRSLRLRLLSQALLVIGGVLLGVALARVPTAEAEVRRGRQQESFKVQSFPLLRDIAGILTRMDARVAKIEKSLDEIVVLKRKEAR